MLSMAGNSRRRALAYFRVAVKYIVTSMDTGTSTIFGLFQAIVASSHYRA
jgi:hypothetical protein